jgi:hypothetical protein
VAIEQKDSVVRPSIEVTMLGEWQRKIGTKLVSDVDQAGGKRANPWGNRKSKTHGVAGAGIRILAHDERSNILRFEIECCEDMVRLRRHERTLARRLVEGASHLGQ